MNFLFAAVFYMLFQFGIYWPGPAVPQSNSNNITVVEYDCATETGGAGCTQTFTSSATSAKVTLGTATTSGEAIVVITLGGAGGSAYGSVTDSGSQTYTQDATVKKTGVSGHYDFTVWYVCGSASGITYVTWTFGSGDAAVYSTMLVAHAKGVATSSCRDVAANFPSSAASTPFSSSSVTTTYANEWLVGPVFANPSSYATMTGTGNFTAELNAENANGQTMAWLDGIVTATGSYDTTGTGSVSGSYYYPAIVTFHH